MFFTQEDYRKIEQWLQRNSVKDTEFQEALPLNGLETITLVQDENNKKVLIKDLVDQIFKLGVSDFLNVTDKYEASHITLEEAIKLIPSGARKVGLVITFLNTDGNWQVYQFKGVLNQWNQLDLWEDLFDWEKFVIDSILPDEEDLTKSLPDENGNSYLSLKDREYSPEDFSGLGRIILRKNIIEIEDPTYGKVKKNVLYQDMINKENTIYEIRYDFDLNGEEITIPEGCVLDFQGGSFDNGIIKGNINNSYTKPEWFSKNDNTGIQIALSISSNVILSKKEYYVNSIEIPKNTTLTSTCKSVLHYNVVYAKENVNISNITFDGDWDCYGLWLLDNSIVENCKFLNTRYVTERGSGITAAIWVGSYYTEQEGRVINNVSIKNCIFDGIRPKEEDEEEYSSLYPGGKYEGNTYCCRFIISYSCENLYITNNIFKNMSSIYEADMINVRTYTAPIHEFPYKGNSDLWSGSGGYTENWYVGLATYISGNTFICGRIKSVLKLMGGNVQVSDNVFKFENNNNIRKSYAIIRSYGIGNTICNNIIKLDTNNFSTIFNFERAKDNVCCNNVITSSEDVDLTSGSIFSIATSHNVFIHNNNISLKEVEKFCTGECNGTVTISNNSFNLIYAKEHGDLKWYGDPGNHYSYPDQSTLGVFTVERNRFTIDCRTDSIKSYTIGTYRENSFIFANNIVSFLTNIPKLYITPYQSILDKEGIANVIDNNTINSDIYYLPDSLSRYHKSGVSISSSIKNSRIAMANFYDTSIGTISDCVFTDNTDNRFVGLYDCKNLKFTNNSNIGYKGNFFRIETSPCKMELINNTCNSLNAYLINGGSIAADSFYRPSVIPTAFFDYGPKSNMNTLASRFKLLNRHKFIVTDEIGGPKIYYSTTYSSGSIGWEIGDFYAGSFDSRPNSAPEGTLYWDMTNKRPMWKQYGSGDIWVDGIGRVIAKLSGESSERPINVGIGFCYFDTTINKPIWKTALGWVDATGAEV